jgi:hypothetical protein
MKHPSISNCITAVLFAFVCFILTSRREWGYLDWERVKMKMLGFSPEGDYYFLSERGSSNGEPNVSIPDLEEEYKWEESAYHRLPKNVKRYFHRAFIFTGEKEAVWEDTIRMLKSVDIDEEGVLMLRGKWWAPFTSRHILSANPFHPGFVQDIQLSIPSPIALLSDFKIQIRDTYFNGKESREGKAMKVIPIADNFVLSEPSSGGLLRWLAESVYFPTSLLPHDSEGMQWSTENMYHGPKKIVESLSSSNANFVDPNTSKSIKAEFRFDNDGLVSSIFAYAEKSLEDGTIFMSPWECRFYEYKLVGYGMMVPTRVEYGWQENGEFQPYYKATCKNFTYTYF